MRYYSSALTHFGNIAYRVKRRLELDRESLRFVGDAEANQLLGREHRKSFEIAAV